MATSTSKLNKRNYREWAVEAENVLFGQGLWKFVTREMIVPRPLIMPVSAAVAAATIDNSSTSTSTTPARPIARDLHDADYDFLPESADVAHLTRFENFLWDWERWQINNDKAARQITTMTEPAL